MWTSLNALLPYLIPNCFLTETCISVKEKYSIIIIIYYYFIFIYLFIGGELRHVTVSYKAFSVGTNRLSSYELHFLDLWRKLSYWFGEPL